MAKKKPAPQPYAKPDQIQIRGQPDLQHSSPEVGCTYPRGASAPGVPACSDRRVWVQAGAD